MIRMAESRQTGVFNASGAEDDVTMGEVANTCREASGSNARLVWAEEQFLVSNGVVPWSELPLWVPSEHNGIFSARNDKAMAAGLTFRPLAETVRSTLAWDRTRSQETPLAAGLSTERERQLLALYGAADSAH
jgi:2'-hydroxyisoflavone reductase